MNLDILDFCESENRSHMVETEKQLLETELSTEFEEDLNMAIGKDNTGDESEKYDKQDNMDNNDDSDQDMENESILSDKDSEQDDDHDELSSEETNRTNVKSNEYSSDDTENEESKHSDASEQADDSKGLWEDIYGRQRDKKGNVISNKYVPPAARVASTGISVDTEKAHRLEKQFKGILNKLAEQNMHIIANQVIYYLNICICTHTYCLDKYSPVFIN